jgi:hypothetical protein
MKAIQRLNIPSAASWILVEGAVGYSRPVSPIFGPKPTDLATYEGIQVLVGATWISFEFANLRFSAGLKHPANRPFFARGHRMLQSLAIY